MCLFVHACVCARMGVRRIAYVCAYAMRMYTVYIYARAVCMCVEYTHVVHVYRRIYHIWFILMYMQQHQRKNTLTG